METLSFITVGIALFIFWFFVGAFAPEPDSISVFSRKVENLVVCLVLAGFVWLLINLVLPIFQGWLIPVEWVKYSSIFWWISFIGGVLGSFLVPKPKDSKV